MKKNKTLKQELKDIKTWQHNHREEAVSRSSSLMQYVNTCSGHTLTAIERLKIDLIREVSMAVKTQIDAAVYRKKYDLASLKAQLTALQEKINTLDDVSD